MKPAVALFTGIFASGLALASFVEPTNHKVTCRTYYTFETDAGPVQKEGPQLADQNNDGDHHESYFDKEFGVKFSYDWNEASNFRDLHAKIEVKSDQGMIEAATFGKPSTAVHLTDLNIEIQQAPETALTSISLFCGIAPQF